MDLMTAQVVTARGGNVTFHEEYTTDSTYVRHLMQNAFADGDHKLPETVPVARIKTKAKWLRNCISAYRAVPKATKTEAEGERSIAGLRGGPCAGYYGCADTDYLQAGSREQVLAAVEDCHAGRTSVPEGPQDMETCAADGRQEEQGHHLQMGIRSQER
ncbi:unnamed protein product [Phytophthora fragariaefolia]|uniref:Unnamed protein product n=1 Tax=Phytophthora fragariaefolia TaxID=1490495 RepID=A0A9W6WZB0_9STRA|nr:unnamed protein product [Phytophthora fragariaefolia]